MRRPVLLASAGPNAPAPSLPMALYASERWRSECETASVRERAFAESTPSWFHERSCARESACARGRDARSDDAQRARRSCGRGKRARATTTTHERQQRLVDHESLGDRAAAGRGPAVEPRAVVRGGRADLVRAADEVAREVERVHRAVALELVEEHRHLDVVEVRVRHLERLDAAHAAAEEARERVRRVAVEVVVRDVELAQRDLRARASAERARVGVSESERGGARGNKRREHACGGALATRREEKSKRAKTRRAPRALGRWRP